VPILGTSPSAIDLAEERGLFSKILDDAQLLSPANGIALNLEDANSVAERIGYPVLVRPSFVLGGRGMEIVYDTNSLSDYFERIADQGIVGPGYPLLVDRFLDDAIEIDIDALYDGTELYVGGVMEHIEEAGIHSGDSSCTLPPVTMSQAQIDRVRVATEKIAAGIGVRGLINVQFALAHDVLYVLEANPRASRTVPFVSKALGITLAKAASLVMVGKSIADLIKEGHLPSKDGTHIPAGQAISVKEAVLPFKRFATKDGRFVDSLLGPEMRSTGEVMGIDVDFPTAFAKSQAAAGSSLPISGSIFISVADRDKPQVILPVRRLHQLGYKILATSGTAQILERHGITTTVVRKHSDDGDTSEPSIVDLISAGRVDVVVNTPSGSGLAARKDGYEIRAATTAADKAIFTTIAQLSAAIGSFEAVIAGPFKVKSLQDHAAERAAALA
jgi:carbamoyl-phosphate synthase large subunit